MSQTENKPNILLVISDQLSAQALPAYGNSHALTPNLDRIFGRSTRFDSAYSNCPLCQPSRASFWTGRYPHDTGVLSNGHEFPVTPVDVDLPTVGSVFREAGYRTEHFGKQHDAGGLRGFNCAPVERIPVNCDVPGIVINYDTERDRNTCQQITQFLSQYTDPAPFLAVADFNNPHEICSWIGRYHKEPVPAVDEPLPPLPENLHRPDGVFENLPLPVRYLCCAHNRQAQISEWDELKLQHYLRAYYHYVEQVDTEIGRILDALARSPNANNTLIVFMADHGDSMTARWMATKHCTFYEETMHIPLAFAGPGIVPQEQPVNALCSLIDLFPTLCDLADIPQPDNLRGESLAPYLRGDADTQDREYVAAEWHTEWGFTIEPGRMIRTKQYKYTCYLEGEGEELYSLESDPGELVNLATNPDYAEALASMRSLLNNHLATTGDPFREMEWKADPQWRSHPPGYRNHRGPTAAQV